MNRRGFLAAILAAGIAPAVVKAASLMPVRALDSGVLVLDNGIRLREWVFDDLGGWRVSATEEWASSGLLLNVRMELERAVEGMIGAVALQNPEGPSWRELR